jgi:negative regulator of sigma E activity
MNRFSEETLMAYADGELDLVVRAEIEAAMAHDPEVARAVERHRLMAAQVRAAYDGVLDEPVPERLATLVASAATAPVIDLAARRDGRRISVGPLQMPAWVALAASVAVGLFVGILLMRSPAAVYEAVEGALVARGALDQALDSQLASAPGDSGVRIGISFKDRNGDYCRTFHLQRDVSAAGLACRSDGSWHLQVLAAAPAIVGELQPAAAMPIPVLHAVDAAIDGEPLDPAAEAAARDAGWR